jgi:hypothetical protein
MDMVNLKIDEKIIYVAIARILLVIDCNILNIFELGSLVFELIRNEMNEFKNEKNCYSDNLNQLIILMLEENPNKRLTVNQLKEFPQIKNEIISFQTSNEKHNPADLNSKLLSLNILIKLAKISNDNLHGEMTILCLFVLTEMIIVELRNQEKEENKQFLNSVVTKISGIMRLWNIFVNSCIKEVKELIAGFGTN